jgi:hypothetical protein
LPSYHIDGPDCIQPNNRIRHKPLHQDPIVTEGWLPDGPVQIGITSGASTPDRVVEEVILRIFALREHLADPSAGIPSLLASRSVLTTLFQVYLPLLGWTLLGFVLQKRATPPWNHWLDPQALGRFMFWVGVPLGIVGFMQTADLSGQIWVAPFGLLAVHRARVCPGQRLAAVAAPHRGRKRGIPGFGAEPGEAAFT